MEIICHRCHETIREDDRYCPVCGLPHLLYVASDAPSIPYGRDAEAGLLSADSIRGHSPLTATDNATGGRFEGIGSATGIAWRPALRAAMIFSIPAAILSSGLTPLGLICMAGAAAWAVSTYSKRTRINLLSMSAGARIGLMTGIMASWLTLGLGGASLWISRFILHQGGQIDSMWTTQVMANFDRNQQMIAQMGLATAQSTQFALAMREWMLSTDGRAGLALSGFLMVAAFLILFATVGGAVAARFLKPSHKPGS